MAANNATPRNSPLWLWVLAAFALQAAAWTAWFIVASNHKVQEVPLVRVGHFAVCASPRSSRVT
jgi:hypothetical protein